MEQTPSPRIGIIGAGAIGGYYGLLMARAGLDVHFLLRSDYAVVAERGLSLDSAVHGLLHADDLKLHRRAEDMPPCDWLLVGAKTTSNAELAPLLNRLAAPAGRVVLLQNGLAVEESLRPLLDPSLHLLGGLCYICVHRAEPGRIVHQSLGTVSLGYHSGPETDVQVILDEGLGLFRQAGIEANVAVNLAQARWSKLVWNVPYNGLSVLLDAGTDALMRQPDSRALIAALMGEVIEAAEACGHPLPEGLADKLLAVTDRMPDYLPSMYHDFKQRRPMELDAVYAAPLAAAAEAGVSLPRMRMLLQSLRFIESR